MGLDMYLFKLRKISEKAVKPLKTDEDVHEAGYNVFYTQDDEECLRLIQPLIDAGFAIKTKLDVKRISESRIRKDAGVPDKVDCIECHYGQHEIEHWYSWKDLEGEEHKVDFVITKEDFESKYTDIVNEEAYITSELKDVDYWHKYYDLEDFIYEMYPGTIENCGYYPLDEEQLEQIRDFIKEDCGHKPKPYRFDPEYEVICYYEWD